MWLLPLPYRTSSVLNILMEQSDEVDEQSERKPAKYFTCRVTYSLRLFCLFFCFRLVYLWTKWRDSIWLRYFVYSQSIGVQVLFSQAQNVWNSNWNADSDDPMAFVLFVILLLRFFCLFWFSLFLCSDRILWYIYCSANPHLIDIYSLLAQFCCCSYRTKYLLSCSFSFGTHAESVHLE